MLPLCTLPLISDGSQLPLCFMSTFCSFYSPVSDQVLWLFPTGSCIVTVKPFPLALILSLTTSCPKRIWLTPMALCSPIAAMTYHFPRFQLQLSLLTLSFPWTSSFNPMALPSSICLYFQFHSFWTQTRISNYLLEFPPECPPGMSHIKLNLSFCS